MARRKRRTRSPHPGVKLHKRVLADGRSFWRARFVDPDNTVQRRDGKWRETDVTLDPVLSTHEARTLWAVEKSEALRGRRMALKSGAPLKTATPLADAIATFMRNAADRLRPSTLTTYRQGVGRFDAWAQAAGIKHAEDLTTARLTAFRNALLGSGKRIVVKGARRGTRNDATHRRAAVTTNTYLTSTKILLNHLRSLGQTPALNSDAITDALKPLPRPREQPEYLRPSQLQQLLAGALRHDADTFKATRLELARGLKQGATRRYVSIAPLTAFLLLSGCRRGEALGLKWTDIDLDATDNMGRTVGEIRLRGEHTKTQRARTIGLEVSPALRALLAAMKLRAGGAGFVFGGATPYTVDLLEAARARLAAEYGAPAFAWKTLRSTCSTYLTNAPGIFGSSAATRAAQQLGHSVVIAERHYVDLLRGIPREAHTLEAAMQVGKQLGAIEGAIAPAQIGGTVRMRMRSPTARGSRAS